MGYYLCIDVRTRLQVATYPHEHSKSNDTMLGAEQLRLLLHPKSYAQSFANISDLVVVSTIQSHFMIWNSFVGGFTTC